MTFDSSDVENFARVYQEKDGVIQIRKDGFDCDNEILFLSYNISKLFGKDLEQSYIVNEGEEPKAVVYEFRFRNKTFSAAVMFSDMQFDFEVAETDANEGNTVPNQYIFKNNFINYFSDQRITNNMKQAYTIQKFEATLILNSYSDTVLV